MYLSITEEWLKKREKVVIMEQEPKSAEKLH